MIQRQPGELRTKRPRSQASYVTRKMSPDAIERHRLAQRERDQRPEVLEARRQRMIEKRRLVIEHYGGKCLCCGMSELKFLTIDHTTRDGAAHRREEPAARELYSWLVKNDFPDGGRFRVLCVYCHHAVTHYGACPHDPERINQRRDGMPDPSSTPQEGK